MRYSFSRTFLVGLLAFGAAAVAEAQYASPELMFVYDGGDGSANHVAKIDRYDPVNRQDLGSFGQGFLPQGEVGAMTVIGHNLYFLTNNGNQGVAAVVGFNFSTGQEDYSHAITGQGFISAMAAVNGQLVLGGYGSGTLDVLDPSLNTSSTVTLDGFSQVYALAGSGSTLAVTGQASSGAQGYGTFAATSNDTGFSKNFITTGDGYLSMAMSADQQGNLRLFGVGSTANFDGVEERDPVTGALLDSSGNIMGGGIYVDSSTLATGHNGELYGLRTSNAVAVVNDDLPLILSGSGDPAIQLTNTYAGVMVAVYAAPEPLPVIAFAVASIALLAVRKSRS